MSLFDTIDYERWVEGLRRPIRYAMLAAILVLPLALNLNNYFLLVLSLIGIYLLVVTGLDILYGFSGQVSLGHAAFFGIGAYVSALATTELGLSVWLAMGLAIFAGVLVGVVLAWPSVKLVHHFLALVTIGFGEIVRLAFLNSREVTGGFEGIGGIPAPSIAGFEFGTNQRYYYLVVAFAFLGIIIKRNLRNSAWGRRLLSVRENAQAAEAFGTPLLRTRTIAFAISAAYGALAGSLYVHLVSYVSPGTFTFEQSTIFLTMVLIGGYGTVWGPVIGVAALTLLIEYGQQFERFQGVFLGLAIIVIVAALPRGIVGSLEDMYSGYVRRKAKRAGRGATVVDRSEQGASS